MASIISTEGLGLYNAALARSNTSSPQSDQVFVNAATGNVVVQRQDDYLASLGLDLGLVRTYNAQGLLNDDNGDNWRLNVHQRVTGLTGVVNTAGSTVTKVYGDGYEAVFAFDVVIPPFLAKVRSRDHAALASFWYGVIPPSALFGRSA